MVHADSFAEPSTRSSWGLLAPDPTIMSPRALLAHGPTRITDNGKTKALVGNFSDSAALIRVGTPLGFFSIANPDDFVAAELTPGDPHYKRELQDTLEAAVAAEARADAQLPAMYLPACSDLGAPSDAHFARFAGPLTLNLRRRTRTAATAANSAQISRVYT